MGLTLVNAYLKINIFFSELLIKPKSFRPALFIVDGEIPELALFGQRDHLFKAIDWRD